MNRRLLLIPALLALLVLMGRSATHDASARPLDPTPPPTPLPFPPDDGQIHLAEHDLAKLADRQPVENLTPLGFTPCNNGFAGTYPCLNVDMMSFLPWSALGGGQGSANWGWTDPLTGKEYAIMGRSNGTAFVDISDLLNPVYLGNLPTQTYATTWRELKTYNNYAFIVADAAGNHGMQIFDLTQLREVSNPPVTFAATTVYTGFQTSHTITVNEATGFIYANGTNTCSGGLHMVDVHDPLHPAFAGCFSADGYTHDSQCVLYNGPDADHTGKEICFASNEDTLTIVNVTDKSAPLMLSRTGYTGRGYTHQGWLSEDQRYFLLDDEFDELNTGRNTTTYVWNVSNLDAPSVLGTYVAATRAIDHNQFVLGNLNFQANYRAGLPFRSEGPWMSALTSRTTIVPCIV